MSHQCRECGQKENVEYHNWQCTHCGFNNLEMKIKVSIELEAELPEDEVRAINKLSVEERKRTITEIKNTIRELVKKDLGFEEEHIQTLDLNYD